MPRSISGELPNYIILNNRGRERPSIVTISHQVHIILMKKAIY